VGRTYLVTGCAGFIGSHTCDALIARGDTVVGLDNLDPYYSPARKRANIEEIRSAPGAAERFTFVEGDIRDRDLLRTLFDTHAIDGIAHLAAMAGVRISVEQPHLYVDVNLVGTLNLLEEARRKKTGTFVFAGTSSAYGATDKHPFVETDSADRPLAPYPASKRAAELMGYAYHHLHGVNFTALRFFTVYGPRGRPDMMAYKVLDSMFRGVRSPLYNGGQMYRDWTFVTDIVAGVASALERPLGYEIVNIGRGEPVLLKSFVNDLEKLAGREAALDDEPMLAADVPYTFADITKARTLLGYEPKVSVTEGTQRFWDWYQANVLPSAT
jgi:UDP-glucuronate 4-epimerase